MRVAIWRNTLVTAAVYALFIVEADRLIRARLSLGSKMNLALAFAAVQTVAILVMVAGLLARKQWNVIRLARTQRLGPQVQEALALHAIGIDQRARLEQLRRQAPEDVRDALFAMLASTRGEPRERLVMLAADLGFVERRKEREIDWVRNLVRVRHGEAFGQIVAAVADASLLVRAIAAEELAPHAAEIPQSQIAVALDSPDAGIVITALDMLRAWRRAIPIRDFARLLAHGDSRVRQRALLVLPYAAADLPAAVLGPGVLASLAHEDGQVREAAATAAGKLGLSDAAAALGAHLIDSDRRVAVAAAFALATLGERGTALLQRVVLSPDRAAASVAFEALEKEALGLAELG